ALVFAATIFLVSRQLVVSKETSSIVMPEMDNILFSASDLNEAIATRLDILLRYLKSLFIPWPLVWDYSYHQIPLSRMSDLFPWLGIFAYGTLIIHAIYMFVKKPPISFSILLFLIALSPVSNVFFINATTIGERLLFFPSIAFCIAITFSLLKRMPGKMSMMSSKIPATLFVLIVVVFSVLTLKGAANWKDNMTLFSHG
ncbi:MAG: hypothetical protein ACKO7B_01700, partial [Flavobacteriales bacterium]